MHLIINSFRQTTHQNRALYNYADPDVIWNSKYSHTPPSKEAYKKSKGRSWTLLPPCAVVGK